MLSRSQIFLTYYDDDVTDYYFLKFSGYKKKTSMIRYSNIYNEEKLKHESSSLPQFTNKMLDKEKIDSKDRSIIDFIKVFRYKKQVKLIINE